MKSWNIFSAYKKYRSVFYYDPDFEGKFILGRQKKSQIVLLVALLFASRHHFQCNNRLSIFFMIKMKYNFTTKLLNMFGLENPSNREQCLWKQCEVCQTSVGESRRTEFSLKTLHYWSLIPYRAFPWFSFVWTTFWAKFATVAWHCLSVHLELASWSPLQTIICRTIKWISQCTWYIQCTVHKTK